jgi:SAM-dependent methyltransferase
MAEPEVPPGVDISKPSIARVYDALLGGSANFPADRAVAQQMIDSVPGVTEAPRLNRAALGRAIRYLTTVAGIDQFLDLGSGLPTQDNVHQVAQRYLPSARVAYVDNDPLVLAQSRALLAGSRSAAPGDPDGSDDQTIVVTADIRQPDQVLSDPDVRRLIDFDRPVGLIMCAILHHLLDEEEPVELVARYREALAPGSHLFITHVCVADDALIDKLEPISIEHLGTGVFRTLQEIEEFFGGWQLLSPGVVFVPLWHPGEPSTRDPGRLSEVERMAAAGLAYQPIR